MNSSEKRQQMAMAIVKEFEGRYSGGKLQCYNLPAGDGGGAFEIAGINEKYHGPKARVLRSLIQGGKHDQAEKEAAAYIEEYTRPVLKFFPSPEAADANPALEFILRDAAFNRGAKGAATILQIALGMTAIDGAVGAKTRAEFGRQLALGPDHLLKRLSKARETYERTTYPWKPSARNEQSKFWAGLSNRWAKADRIARERFV
jgi:lysozyme family protein